jgi:molecular chaperone HtpG
MQTGKIGVTAENIFPIIKKFLYSDHEIFLRELISNAIDATKKLKAISNVGDFKGELGVLTVRVKLDKKNKTLSVTDQGVGMTGEEIEKFINEIAFSSAEEFLEKYKNQEDAIIGHFGLGFYSSFMVSDKVEIYTKSYKKNAKAVKWTCSGTPEYSLEEIDKKERGTEVILYLDKDSKEFLEENRINELLRKYCRFLPIEIAFGKEKEWKDGKEVELDKDKIINDTKPLWTKKPSGVKEEDYKKFYRDLYPIAEEPLFNIHINVDYPFNLTGILYFPKIRNNIEIQKNKIQLYCNQVYVTDSVEGIVPEFLTLLHGVLDSPDIPLNVSRSFLQNDQNVKKISSHITKKVADKLNDIFKNNRSEFEKKWDDIKLFIEYGMMTEEKFHEKGEKFALLKNTDGKYFTFDDL